MKNNQTALILFAGILFTILAGFSFADKSPDPKKNNDKAPAQIEWISFEEAEKRSKKKPRKIFVDVYTDWCGWCKKMDKDTFSNPEIAEYVNNNFYAVKFNAEGKEPVNIKGRTYTLQPGYKTHELAIELLSGKMGYPTTVYLDDKLNVLEVKPGYLTPEQFKQVLSVHGGDNTSKKSRKK